MKKRYYRPVGSMNTTRTASAAMTTIYPNKEPLSSKPSAEWFSFEEAFGHQLDMEGEESPSLWLQELLPPSSEDKQPSGESPLHGDEAGGDEHNGGSLHDTSTNDTMMHNPNLTSNTTSRRGPIMSFRNKYKYFDDNDDALSVTTRKEMINKIMCIIPSVGDDKFLNKSSNESLPTTTSNNSSNNSKGSLENYWSSSSSGFHYSKTAEETLRSYNNNDSDVVSGLEVSHQSSKRSRPSSSSIARLNCMPPPSTTATSVMMLSSCVSPIPIEDQWYHQAHHTIMMEEEETHNNCHKGTMQTVFYDTKTSQQFEI